MIVLDTNVVSALMRNEPDPSVVSWLDSLLSESVWTTSVTVFEVRLGLEILVAQAGDGVNWKRLSRRRSKRTSRAECCLSTSLLPKPQAESPRSGAAPVVLSRFVTSRLPESPRRERPPSRLATFATSRDAA